MIINRNSPPLDTNVYNGDAALTVQSYTEINSKRGTQWEAQVVLTSLAQNTPQYYAFTTTSNPVSVKHRLVSGEIAQLTYEIFTGADITGGTPSPIGNMNDRLITTETESVVINPTVNGLGTAWQPPFVILGDGSNKSNSRYGESIGERVLDNPKTYLIRITNNTSTTVPIITIDLSWYSGPLDVDIRSGD